MFTWIAILCVVVASLTKAKRVLKEKNIRSPNDTLKSYLKTWDQWNIQSFQEHCPWTPQGQFTARHINPQLQGVNVLMHVGLWPMAIKLNPLWKTRVSKNAWIKPCWRSLGFTPQSAFQMFLSRTSLLIDAETGFISIDSQQWYWALFTTFLFN